MPRLSEKQFAQLEAELARGPVAHGREDQRWTLARVKTVIGWRFHLAYTIQGVRKLLVRNGWSCQVPARRAMERDDEAVAACQQHRSAGPTQADGHGPAAAAERQPAQTSASSAGTVVARPSSLRAATDLFGSMSANAGS
ncbi:winged helix-turn-helix domain-containing protein [Streptomyces sp. NPDC014622]|uniref:winged helix-turn-helix domain-containing protein n=1 Tax=Streptomyces sp. NPDC014622 TaxID=3364874 RepID=UPI0036F620B4